MWLVSSVVSLALLLIGVVVVVYWRQKQHLDIAPQSSTTEATPPAAPALKPTKAQSDIQVGPITFEKTEGSRLVYAVGTVTNASDYQHFGVRIELDLFDTEDANIGTATDYAAVLEPHHEWRFRALLSESKAVRAKVGRIIEQN